MLPPFTLDTQKDFIMTPNSIQNGTYQMLDPEDTVFLLIDHQAGLMLFPKDIDPLTLRSNSIALAKVAKLHDIPVVLTAADSGPDGPIGPIIPEIRDLFPDVDVIYRTKINSWEDDDIRGAIEATGRKQLVTAGITADFCSGLPAKSAAAAGYDSRNVLDCSGLVDEYVRDITISNLAQHGVAVTNWLAVACELMGDWAKSETASQGLLDIYAEHLPEWGMLDVIEDARKARGNKGDAS